MLNVNIEGIEGAQATVMAPRIGEQVVVDFANGYQASIVENELSYGTELAVMIDGKLKYDTPITDDVIGYLTDEKLRETLVKIAALPERRDIKVDYWAAYTVTLKLLEEFGRDYTIPFGGCVYVTRDYNEEGDACSPLRPSCIVGQVLHRMGVSVDLMDDLSVLAHERESFGEYGVTFTDRAFLYLDTMQAIQDNGEQWGLAHDIASRVASRRKYDESEMFVSV